MHRRFEFVGGSSAKFWEVTATGCDLTVRYGRLGTQGQSQLKAFGSEAEATGHAEKLIERSDLDRLFTSGLVHHTLHHGDTVVGVYPPLLAEFLRREGSAFGLAQARDQAGPGAERFDPIDMGGADAAVLNERLVRGTADRAAWAWEVSPAVSGLVVYSGGLFPEWAGTLMTGALQHDAIIRLGPGSGGLVEVERLFDGVFPRIRDVREAPDGAIWFLSEGDGAAYRMRPAGGS